MGWRGWTLLILAYVTLDLSNPFMPGAFTFDPEDCVEGIHHPGSRLALRADQASVSPETPGAPQQQRPAVSEFLDRRPGLRRNFGDWLIDVRRAHPPSEDASPRSEDH